MTATYKKEMKTRQLLLFFSYILNTIHLESTFENFLLAGCFLEKIRANFWINNGQQFPLNLFVFYVISDVFNRSMYLSENRVSKRKGKSWW